jgi:hypothetical protein
MKVKKTLQYLRTNSAFRKAMGLWGNTLVEMNRNIQKENQCKDFA